MSCCRVTEQDRMEVYHALQQSFIVNPTPLPTVSTKMPLLFRKKDSCMTCGNNISYPYIVSCIKALIQLRTDTNIDKTWDQDTNDFIRYYLDFMSSEGIYSSLFSVFIHH